jgi:hypothetical protein
MRTYLTALGGLVVATTLATTLAGVPIVLATAHAEDDGYAFGSPSGNIVCGIWRDTRFVGKHRVTARHRN